MKRIKTLAIILTALCVIAITTATAASAESTPLPDIHTALPSENYPLILEATAKQEKENDISLANAQSKLPAEAVKILLTLKELAALGTATIDFTGVHVGPIWCNTTGDATGVVLVPIGEFHLVYTSLSPAHSLETAVLFLFIKFISFCGALETTVSPPWLARENDVTEASGDSTDLEIASHCSNIANGIQELSSYFDATLTEKTGQLLKANISGTGEANSCQEIKPTLLFKVTAASTARMFTVLL